MIAARTLRTSLLAMLAMSTLAACGAAAPPAKELSDEIIDTMDLSPEVTQCMHEAVEGFPPSSVDFEGFEDFDDVARKAADGQQKAIEILGAFEAALAECNAAG